MFKRQCMLLLLALAIVVAAGCATVGDGNGTTDKERMERVIQTIQRVEHGLQWIAPIACGLVVVAMDPAAGVACRVAQAGLEAITVATDLAVAQYRDDPTPANAEHVVDLLSRLQEAWNAMDAAYKGDVSKLKTLSTS